MIEIRIRFKNRFNQDVEYLHQIEDKNIPMKVLPIKLTEAISLAKTSVLDLMTKESS